MVTNTIWSCYHLALLVFHSVLEVGVEQKVFCIKPIPPQKYIEIQRVFWTWAISMYYTYYIHPNHITHIFWFFSIKSRYILQMPLELEPTYFSNSIGSYVTCGQISTFIIPDPPKYEQSSATTRPLVLSIWKTGSNSCQYHVRTFFFFFSFL